jgi:lauroyl/myristoyl acyltransferase
LTDIEKIINSSISINLLSSVARMIPASLGLGLANLAATSIVNQPESKLVRAVRANQWVIGGETMDRTTLDKAVHETFRQTAISLFDLYHYKLAPSMIDKLVVFNPPVQKLITRPAFSQRGLLLVGFHISNFDLVLRAITFLGLKAMILTIPNPQGSHRREYEMRKRNGMELVPTSFNSLRQAVRTLQKGGMVVTGIDRPITSPKYRPHFFGRPADLPTHHVFLAIKAKVPVIVIVTIRQPDGKNHVYTSEPIEMEEHPDADRGVLLNAEKILRIGEDYIRQVPNQWSISLPVWPGTIEKVPL